MAGTTGTAVRLPEFRVMELRDIDDPYPIFAALRAAGTLFKGDPGAWGVTHHADVAPLLRDRRLAHEFPPDYMQVMMGGSRMVAEFNSKLLLNRDPPHHTRLRTLMGKAFSASLVRRLRHQIRDMVDELLEPALDRGSFDVVTDLAFPLPVNVICQLLGLHAADHDEIRPHAANLTSSDTEAGERSLLWFRDYIDGVLAERCADPEGDLLERMLAAEEGGDALSHEEIVDNAVLLFFAGFETTSNLIATGAAALLDFPDQRDKLLARPDLSVTAIEEFLRYDAPVSFVPRLTLEPIEVGPREIPAQRVVLLMLGAANRDEAVFKDPEKLDIERSPNPHVAFGGGIHHCLGAQLARVEADVVFGRLAERCATLEAAGPAVRRLGTNIRSFVSVPVAVTAA